jgi:hypothetical protein
MASLPRAVSASLSVSPRRSAGVLCWPQAARGHLPPSARQTAWCVPRLSPSRQPRSSLSHELFGRRPAPVLRPRHRRRVPLNVLLPASVATDTDLATQLAAIPGVRRLTTSPELDGRTVVEADVEADAADILVARSRAAGVSDRDCVLALLGLEPVKSEGAWLSQTEVSHS